MNILYIHRTQCSLAEGTHVREMIRAFRALGHTVMIVSPPGIDPFAPPTTARADSAMRRMWRWISRRTPAVLFEVLEILYNWVAGREVSRVTAGVRIDCVYERYTFYGWAGAVAARRFRVPLLLEVNYSSATPLYRKKSALLRPLRHLIERRVFARAQGLFVVSGYLKRCLADTGIAVERLVLTPNAVSRTFWESVPDGTAVRREFGLSDRTVIGFTGGFFPWHGLDLLLRAVCRLRRSYPTAAVLLVGDGPMKEQLQAMAREWGVTDAVVFAGVQPHERLAEYISAMDICVMPDSNEYGSPMKIFEYMALARPVVAPALGPLQDVITHAENGLLFAPGDSDGLADCLAQLCADGQLRSRIGTAARTAVGRRHLWEHNAQAVLECYHRATAADGV